MYEEWPEVPLFEGIPREGITQTPQFSENTPVHFEEESDVVSEFPVGSAVENVQGKGQWESRW